MVDISEMSQLDKLEVFFACNMNIKKSIVRLAFDETKVYNQDYAVRYADEIDKELNYIESQFMVIAEVLELGDELKAKIKRNLEAYYRVFLNCSINPSKLQNFYTLCISLISPELVNKIKLTCVGHTKEVDIGSLINQNVSINGLLHILHSYVMNNNKLYESVDLLSEKINLESVPIYLRGNANNLLAAQIFTNFPDSLDVGITEILSLKNKTLLMVRDRGHALTIEVEEYSDGVMIRYFIPKLCNIDMINALPGINKVPLDIDMFAGARGEFMSSKENVCDNVYNFIARVPTDLDMEFDFENIQYADPASYKL